jgi:hypothetical protein
MTFTDLIPGVSQAKAIIGGIMVAGVLGFVLWGLRVDHLRAEHLTDLHAAQAQLQAESNAHQVTIQSLDQCMSNVDALNAQSEARAKAYADSQAASESAAQDAAKAREALKVYQARLKGMADHAEAAGKCPMSDDLRAEMEKFYAKP